MMFMALAGTAGILLILDYLTGWIRLPRGRTLSARLGGATGDSITVLRQSPILARLLGSLLHASVGRLLALLPSQKHQDLLVRAGFPAPYTSVEDLYAWKVILAVLLGVTSLILGLALGPATAVLALPVMGSLGFFIPDLHLRQAASRREEEIIAEMSYVLDRIAIQLAAGRTLPVVIGLVAEGPGGWFVRELKHVAQEYHSGVDLVKALEAMAERNRVEEIDRFVSRLTVSLRRGANLSDALQVMAQTSREKLESRILGRGLVNAVLMPIPLGLVLMLGLGLTVIGPAVFLATRTLF